MTELFQELQELRTILCVCPCCGDIVRISDLKLKTKKGRITSWRDTFDKKMLELSRQENEFEQSEEKLREQAQERGRKSAEKIFNDAISPSLKKLKYNPLDIKPIFYPIDFVVFNGMNNKNRINNLIFLSQSSSNKSLNSIRNWIEYAIKEKSYEWKEARIDDTGSVSIR